MFQALGFMIYELGLSLNVALKITSLLSFCLYFNFVIFVVNLTKKSGGVNAPVVIKCLTALLLLRGDTNPE